MEPPAGRLARRHRPGARRGHAVAGRGDAVPLHRQARRAQRAHGLPAGRDAVAAARLPRGGVVNEAAAWDALAAVPDPEVPALSVVDLGIVRELSVEAGGRVAVTLTPTYSGCPATEVIEAAVVDALRQAGARDVQVHTRLDPPWTTDWIGAEAAEKLRRYGIAPPHHRAGDTQPLQFRPRGVACPRCGSLETRQLSAFGATACKALYRCTACLEPFELFKPI
ncbi:MAG: phenylacetate-CoA oxygenase subunit PaaJ [Piscinibacter sp.]|nr:phenylacetate-CoA oxygenase subunit PaaJ [Piscinibacter sp.]